MRESDGEKKKLLDEIEQVKNSVRSAKQQTNEEKSLKLFAESKLRDVESRLKTAEQDADSRVHLLASQVAQYSDKIKCLSELNSQLEVNLAESDSSLGAVSEQVIALREENRSLKVLGLISFQLNMNLGTDCFVFLVGGDGLSEDWSDFSEKLQFRIKWCSGRGHFQGRDVQSRFDQSRG